MEPPIQGNGFWVCNRISGPVRMPDSQCARQRTSLSATKAPAKTVSRLQAFSSRWLYIIYKEGKRDIYNYIYVILLNSSFVQAKSKAATLRQTSCLGLTSGRRSDNDGTYIRRRWHSRFFKKNTGADNNLACLPHLVDLIFSTPCYRFRSLVGP